MGDARANRLYWERMVIAKLDRSSLLTHSGTNSRVMAASGPANAAVATHNKFTFFWLRNMAVSGNGAGEDMADGYWRGLQVGGMGRVRSGCVQAADCLEDRRRGCRRSRRSRSKMQKASGEDGETEQWGCWECLLR